MRILVTGSEGFLGKHLDRRLIADGHTALGIDRVDRSSATASLYRQVDITNAEDLLSRANGLAGIDCLVHLAAIAAPRYAETHPAATWSVNVAGTHNVLRLAQKASIPKVVFLSSAHVYGISPRALPSKENDPLNLMDMYTTSKVMGEQLCELFWTNYGVSYTTLRLFNGYGPGQSPDYFMGKKIQEGLTGNLTLRGAKVTKDWVYVDDIVDAIVRATKTAYVGPLNVGTGVEHSLEFIANRIADRFGRTVILDPADDQGPTHMRADISRTRRTLGWEPTVNIMEGLNRTIDGYHP